MNRRILTAWAAPLLLAGWMVTGTAQADDPPPGPGYGWGMMGDGYGPGMMGGYYGMGPGMMGGGYGPGYGHMWGGGYGRGPYGRHGFGPGMMGPWWALDLSDKQRAAIDKIMEDQYKGHWARMTRMFEAQRKLDKLYSADKWDSNAIDKAYDELFKVQREVADEHVRIHNSILEQLTPEQREQLKKFRWRDEY